MDPIAIIGVGCRFPGAEDPKAFWQLLREGQDAIVEVPSTRWDVQAFYDPEPAKPGKMNTRWAGVLNQADQFDPEFFGISPREVKHIDPQQRLVLEVIWEALEQGGIDTKSLSGSRTGVFIGVATVDYHRLIYRHLDNISAHHSVGTSLSVVANRVSYCLNLRGPSLAIDTACSSSLVAVHLACQSLHSGESDLGLVGGVNFILGPEPLIAFSQARMLSPDGRCKTFDAGANGYVRGEGCGVVVLKRLPDALQAGDRILAVIQGTAVNQDGLTAGLTAPNGPAQEAVVREALRQAQLVPSQISYVEAHGTGTPLGDPIEFNALKNVLLDDRPPDFPCWIGSVKTNIGHLEAAAGIAGLIKVVLSLQHQEIPAHLHLQELNPYISLEGTPLRIPTQHQPWAIEAAARYAGVSSFGYGGTNAHVILAEAPPQASRDRSCQPERSWLLLTLSAKSEVALRELAGRYGRHFGEHPELDLADVCFTANRGRTHFKHRLAVVADSTAGFQARLQTFAVPGTTGDGLCWGRQRRSPPVVFLFTGQGAQYAGMGRKLYETEPVFRQALERCDDILRSTLDNSLLEVLYGSDTALLDQTVYTQPVLFAFEYALTQVWLSWGIKPAALLGHSLGEYVAACVAGVFSLEDGLRLVAERGRLIQSLPQNGAMVAAFADRAQVSAVVQAWGQDVAIAACNSPHNTVISGEQQGVAQVRDKLAAVGLETRALNISHGFHSPLMEPMLAALEELFSGVELRSPTLPLMSNQTSQWVAADEPLDGRYWCCHSREAVQFEASIRTLVEQGYPVFLEIGPKQTLCKLGQQCQPQDILTWLPSVEFGQDNWQTMLRSLAALYVQGMKVDWAKIESPQGRQKLSLPTYPFQRKRYWFSPGNADMANEDLKLNSLEQSQSPSSQSDTGRDDRRRSHILEQLRALVGTALHLVPEAVNPEIPMLEMGADSIVFLEIGQKLELVFGVKLSIRQLFEDLSTLETLANYIAQHSTQEFETVSTAGSSASAMVLNEAFPASSVNAQARNGTSVSGEPVYPRKASANGGLQGGGETPLERIMSQQLQAMMRSQENLTQLISEQLSVLSGSDGMAMAKPGPGSPLAKRAGTQDDRSGQSDRPDSSAQYSALVDGKAPQPSRSQGGRNWESEKRQLRDLSPRQQQYLQGLTQRYTQKTAGSKRRAQTYRGVLADRRSTTGFRFETKEMLYPIVGERFQGARFWDIDGNEYIDLAMGFGVHLFGHQASFIVEALQRQIQKGTQTGPQSNLAGEVASLLCELTQSERVCFCNSGTEAVMTALRLVRTVTGRTKVVIFNGAYHGHFDGTLGIPQLQAEGQWQTVPMVPGVPPAMVQDVLVLPYGTERALEVIRTQGHELAAVLVEPVQSRRPDFQPREFLHQLRSLTRNSGTALIFDEVLVGFRIHPGGAQAWFGVEADLVTYGKIMGGGMPIGAIAGKSTYLGSIDGGDWHYGDESYPRAETTFFAGTFSKHPFAMAAAQAVLAQLKTQGNDLLQRLNQRTAQLAQQLNQIFEIVGVPIRVVYFGSLFRFTIANNSSYLFQPLELDLLAFNLILRGVYLWEGRTCFLSTAHTEFDIQAIVEAVKSSIAEIQQGGFFQSSSSENGTKLQAESDRLFEPSSLSIAPIFSFPLTKAQTQLLILAQLGQGSSAAYNHAVVLELQGALNRTALITAIEQVIEAHEVFRTTIDGDVGNQSVWSTLPADFDELDLSHLEPDAQTTQVQDCLEQQSCIPFDLAHGPLLRVRLVKLAPQLHWLMFESHHIMVDGWSMGVVLQDFGQAYSALCEGQAHKIGPRMQFREYVTQHDRGSQSPQLKVPESFWLNQFTETIPVLELPGDRIRPAHKTYAGQRQTLTLEISLRTALKQLGQGQGCSLFMMLLAAYTAFLYRLTGQVDSLVGITGSGRMVAGSENLVGYCSNMLPIRTHLAANQSFLEHLQATRQTLLAAYEHQDYPFAHLLEALQLPWDSSRSPLVSATFNLEPMGQPPELTGLAVRLLPRPIRFMHYDLHFNVINLQEQLILEIDYSTDLFHEETIVRWGRHFQTFLASILAHPTQGVGQIPLLTPKERDHILLDWNDTAVAYPQDQSLHQLFEAQVERTPETIAVIFGEEQLTYAQLEGRSNQLAHHLQSLGVGPEVLVGLCLERSLEMVVGLLGILKAGGAYVPLDPNYPEERLAFMAADAQVSVLLTQARLQQISAEVAPVILCLDSEWEAIAQHPTHRPRSAIQATNLAYVIYTSGSTGQPKGVMNTHQGICNRLRWMQDAYGLTPADRVVQKTPFSFDVSVWEFFWPLCNGAGLVVARPEGHKDPTYLVELIRQHHITTLHFVPPMLQAFLGESSVSQCARLKRVVCSGESLSVELQQQFFERLPHCELHNLYGPTEAGIDVSAWACKPQDPLGLVPIGRPIANTQLYILDDWLEPVPVGVAGELYIGGIQVARGYLNRADLSAERFIASPFGNGRLYKTGDLARYLPNGVIQFLGRKDSQVKLRGFRIELGEVEAALCQLPIVREAVVLVREDLSGEKQLVAYVVPHQSVTTGQELHYALKDKLPAYMVPGAIVLLETLPLTPNGKVDRRALPVPDRWSSSDQTKILPRNAIEQKIAEIWQQLLGISQVGVEESFFELGGHSLRAIQLASRLSEVFGIPMTLLILFWSNEKNGMVSHPFFIPRPTDTSRRPTIAFYYCSGRIAVTVCNQIIPPEQEVTGTQPGWRSPRRNCWASNRRHGVINSFHQNNF